MPDTTTPQTPGTTTPATPADSNVAIGPDPFATHTHLDDAQKIVLAKSLLGQAQGILKTGRAGIHTLGRIIERFHRGSLFRALDPKITDFNTFCDRTLGVKHSEAMVWMHLAETFSEDAVAKFGVTRLEELMQQAKRQGTPVPKDPSTLSYVTPRGKVGLDQLSLTEAHDLLVPSAKKALSKDAQGAEDTLNHQLAQAKRPGIVHVTETKAGLQFHLTLTGTLDAARKSFAAMATPAPSVAVVKLASAGTRKNPAAKVRTSKRKAAPAGKRRK